MSLEAQTPPSVDATTVAQYLAKQVEAMKAAEQELDKVLEEGRQVSRDVAAIQERHNGLQTKITQAQATVRNLRLVVERMLVNPGSITLPSSDVFHNLGRRFASSEGQKPPLQVSGPTISTIEQTLYGSMTGTLTLTRPQLFIYGMLLEEPSGTITLDTICEQTRYAMSTLIQSIDGLQSNVMLAGRSLDYNKTAQTIEIKPMELTEFSIEKEQVAEIVDQLVTHHWEKSSHQPILPANQRPHQSIGVILRRGLSFLVEKRLSGENKIKSKELLDSIQIVAPALKMPPKKIAHIIVTRLPFMSKSWRASVTQFGKEIKFAE